MVYTEFTELKCIVQCEYLPCSYYVAILIYRPGAVMLSLAGHHIRRMSARFSSDYATNEQTNKYDAVCGYLYFNQVNESTKFHDIKAQSSMKFSELPW